MGKVIVLALALAAVALLWRRRAVIDDGADARYLAWRDAIGPDFV